MIDGNTETLHVILSEEEYKKKSIWEPDSLDFYARYPQPPKPVDRFDKLEGSFLVPKNSPEWTLISDNFYLTMPKEKDGKPINTITNIWRYVKKDLIDTYGNNLMKERNKHSHNPFFQSSIEYEKLLWHGTGTTPPNIIASGGWKINYASDKNLWGRGTYFASDASYSAAYAYQDRTSGHKQIFLAKVITGLGIQSLENKNIRDFPKGYNSIVGWRHGSWIYILYENSCAYPWYRVEWSEDK